MLSMTINAIEEKALANSLNISDNINARSGASFTVDTDEILVVGQEVIILDDTTRIFGGTIEDWDKEYLRGPADGSKRRRYNVNCLDFNQIADRGVRVAATYTDKTIDFIVNDIVARFMTGENITVGTIAKGTTVITQAVFNYVTKAEAFNHIRDAAGGDLNWNIDYFKELTFFQRADYSGAAFTDANCKNMKLSESRKDYRNSQLIRAGDSTTEVKVKEPTTPKPDGVSKTFGGRFPVATKPTIYIDNVAVPAADVGINGLDVNKKWYWSRNSKDISQDDSETVLSPTQTLTKSYKGLKAIIVQADDPAGQNQRASIEGGTGIYQSIEDQKALDVKTAALDYAQGLLVRYGTIPRNVRILTDEFRKAGQLIPVQSTNLTINEDFLITNVSIFDFDGLGTLRYNIDAASGEDVGTWVEFFRNLKGGEDLTIRENEVLVLLQTIQEESGWQGVNTIQTFTASYPSDTSYPGEDQFPNGNVVQTYVILD